MRVFWASLCFVSTVIVGCNAGEEPNTKTSAEGISEQPIVRDDTIYDERIQALISQMTPEEKISQLGNTAPAIPRLGLPAYEYWNESLHGVKQNQDEYEDFRATSFPTGIALGSTWDPNLVYEVASAISDEARVVRRQTGKGLTFYAPMIDLLRDPRWGRNDEGYSEDPILTSWIGNAYIQGLQGNDPRFLKAVATAKHFVANNTEYNRHWSSSTVDERDLREYYLHPFEVAVRISGVYSVMPAYNAVNGVPMSMHPLLFGVLRGEWGFQGFVASDCDAVYDIHANHQYVSQPERAAALALRAGTDLNCSAMYPNSFQTHLKAALQQRLISEAEIDTALLRVLRARFFLGDFDTNHPFANIPDSVLESYDHRSLAHEAALKSIVLLKNDGILPLKPASVDSIAIIGPNADETVLGSYSGITSYNVSPYAALWWNFNNWIEAERFNQGSNFQVGDGVLNYVTDGAWAQYPEVDFGMSGGPLSFFVQASSDVAGGTIEVRLDSLEGAVVGRCEIPAMNDWSKLLFYYCTAGETTPIAGTHTVYLAFSGEQGQYLMNVDAFGYSRVAVNYAQGCSIDGAQDEAQFQQAVELARTSDVVLFVGGTNNDVFREDVDRTDLKLPGVQHELIQAIMAVNPNTIVALTTGGALAIPWEQENVPAILSAWYNGQEQGSALVDVLLGRFNPGGRLTTTWYRSVNDLPSFDDYNIRNGRTYMYFPGTPLYPFGYGLSYTTFEYTDLRIDARENGYVDVSVDITNTGEVIGDEVVQLYVRPRSAIRRPNLALKGFQRVTLEPERTTTITLTLTPRDFAYWNDQSHAWTVERGSVDVMVGSSSADIRLTGSVDVGNGYELSSSQP